MFHVEHLGYTVQLSEKSNEEAKTLRENRCQSIAIVVGLAVLFHVEQITGR